MLIGSGLAKQHGRLALKSTSGECRDKILITMTLIDVQQWGVQDIDLECDRTPK